MFLERTLPKAKEMYEPNQKGHIYHFHYVDPEPNADTQNLELQIDGSTIWRSWVDDPSYSEKENLTALGTGFQVLTGAYHTHDQKPLETGGQAETGTHNCHQDHKIRGQSWGQILFFFKS